jgi:hypothetical protein
LRLLALFKAIQIIEQKYITKAGGNNIPEQHEGHNGHEDVLISNSAWLIEM